MGELRKDYILDRYVIIATERAKRPDEFISASAPKKESTLCYFCPGNEHTTPAEFSRYPENSNKWQIRVFPNKFPAVKPEGKYEVTTDNLFYTYSDSYGSHEVIVETPHHDETLSDLSRERIALVLKTFRERISFNLKNPFIKYVSVFKNKGEKAGTSIQHTHCQLIANNIIPEIIKEKENAVQKYGYCPYCAIIEREKNSYRRCYENNTFIAFAPYASRFPFEIWLFPKRHMIKMDELNENEYDDASELLKKILLKLKSLNADYNFYLQYGLKNMHLHIEICPRISTWAGYELSTGNIINTMPPEKAAEFYRQ